MTPWLTTGPELGTMTRRTSLHLRSLRVTWIGLLLAPPPLVNASIRLAIAGVVLVEADFLCRDAHESVRSASNSEAIFWLRDCGADGSDGDGAEGCSVGASSGSPGFGSAASDWVAGSLREELSVAAPVRMESLLRVARSTDDCSPDSTSARRYKRKALSDCMRGDVGFWIHGWGPSGI